MRFFKLSTAALLVVVTTLVSCDTNEVDKVKVKPVRVAKTTLYHANTEKIIIPATVSEQHETKLAFRVGGPLKRLNDIVGSHVEKGAIIAKIDQRDFKIAVESTQSRFELAKAEFERYKNLLESESISKSVFDQIETNYKLANSSFNSAKNALVDTELKAPFSGYINHVFVNNYEEVGPGHPIVSILDLSKLEVKAWVSSKDIVHINEETTFECVINRGADEIRLPGKLKELGSKSSFSKQSYPITVLIDCPKDVSLKPGMTAYLDVEFSVATANQVVLAPVASVFSRNNESYVWIFNPTTKTVSSKKITASKIVDGDMIQVPEGLSENIQVVVTGIHHLFDGQQVRELEQFPQSNIGNKL